MQDKTIIRHLIKTTDKCGSCPENIFPKYILKQVKFNPALCVEEGEPQDCLACLTNVIKKIREV